MCGIYKHQKAMNPPSLIMSVETYHSGAPLLVFMDTSPAYCCLISTASQKNTDILVNHVNNAAEVICLLLAGNCVFNNVAEAIWSLR
ncbi:hypothetical protein RHMOL_Rhmol03G0062500 [Rhododendron molle]|uniref:Uncharacterized protein n=1 Tax=Rhododendron molle TaxID=49168 RepID=A0ACC0PCN2_RHOML|nr:hypothetical protein RHMOL_Rhmol03G0062500 [Rhododendron molle]